MKARAQKENKRICLIKVLAWNINIRLKCKECIYCIDGRCTYEYNRQTMRPVRIGVVLDPYYKRLIKWTDCNPRKEKMAKYASGLTVSSVCKMEVAEAKEILQKYKVSAEDVEIITGMIIEPYFQLSKTCAAGRAYERLVEEVTGKVLATNYLKRLMELHMEEEAKFPFDVLDDDESEEDQDAAER